MRYIDCRGAVQTSSLVAQNSERRLTGGGGSRIQESPEGSPPVHISARRETNAEKRERERERERKRGASEQKEESESRLLLAAVPAARCRWLHFSSPATFFGVCIPNVRSNCC